MGGVIDGDLRLIDDYMVAGQADNSFDKLFWPDKAGQTVLVKDNYGAALRHILMTGDA